MSETLVFDYKIKSTVRGKDVELYGTDQSLNELQMNDDTYYIVDCKTNSEKYNVKCADNRSDIGYINEDSLIDTLNEMDPYDFDMGTLRPIIGNLLSQCDTLQKNKGYYSIPPYDTQYSDNMKIIIDQLTCVMEFYKIGNDGMKRTDIIKLLDNDCFINNFNLYIVILINILENIKLLTEITIDINIISSILKSTSHKIVVVTDKNRCLRLLQQYVFATNIEVFNSKGNAIQSIPKEELDGVVKTPVVNIELDKKIIEYLKLISCSR
jgi:hypothetical protein